MIEFIIQTLLGLLSGFLFNPTKAAPYAKWFIRVRDYLLILLPLDIYPQFQTGDKTLDALGKVSDGDLEKHAIPNEAIKKEASNKGFNWPFVKGK